MIQPMTKGRRCAICHKGPIRGDQITRRGLAKSKGGVGRKITGRSHRSYKPNLQRVRAVVGGKNVRLKVCTSFVKPEDKVIVNSLEVGGHISHQPMGGMGKYTRNILRWPRDPKNGYAIDFAASKDMLAKERPKMVVMGKSLIMLPEPAKEIAAVCK